MTEIKTRRCPTCEGLGRVPEDPAVSQDRLRAEVMERVRQPRPEFAERIARAEQAARDGRR